MLIFFISLPQQRLLGIEWHEEQENVKTQISGILNKVNDLFVITEKRHRELQSKIFDVIESLDKGMFV